MIHHRTEMMAMRRLASVLAVAGVLLATVASPARADDTLGSGFPDVDVPVGGTAIDPLGPNLWSKIGPTTLTGVTVTYALTGVAGVRITPAEQGGGDCTTPSSTRVTCTDPRGLSFEGETVESYLPVEVTAAETAEPGDTGRITITFSADGLTPITGISQVTVVDARDDLPVTGPAAAWIGVFLLAAGTLIVWGTRRRHDRPRRSAVEG